MTVYFVLVPLIFVLLLNLPIKDAMQKAGFFLCAGLCVLQIALVCALPLGFWNGAVLPSFLKDIPAAPLDRISQVMLLIIPGTAFIALIAGNSTIAEPRHRFNFINLVVLAMAGMNGIVTMNNLFSMYIFMEVTAVASFILIASERRQESMEGAFKYVLMSVIATAMILTAVGIFLFAAESTDFKIIRAAYNIATGKTIYNIAMVLLVGGFFIKGGLIPFHGWVADAYTESPTPVSTLLAGVVTKVSGVYTLIRVCNDVFDMNQPLKLLLLIAGAVSIVIGAFLAFKQDNFKRMLAYSSISQIGYIVLSLGAGTSLGMIGAVFHFMNHAILKSQLFINASALETQTGTLRMDDLGGVSKKMPVTGVTSVIASLSTAGIPPLAGFWSKVVIIIALWTSGNIVFAWIAILASIVTLAYFIRAQRKVFFGKLNEALAGVKEARAGILFTAILLASLNIVIGLVFPFFLNFILNQ